MSEFWVVISESWGDLIIMSTLRCVLYINVILLQYQYLRKLQVLWHWWKKWVHDIKWVRFEHWAVTSAVSSFPGSVSLPARIHTDTDLHRAPRTHPGLYCCHKIRPALPFSLIFTQPLFKNSRVRNITGSLHYLCKSSCIHSSGVPSECLS